MVEDSPAPEPGPRQRGIARPVEQRAVRNLGLMSLLPVYGVVVTAVLVPAGSPARDAAFQFLVGYVAALLAFQGAVHWGAALAAAPDAVRGRQSLRWGALPLVLGAIALLLASLGTAPGLIVVLLVIDLGLCQLADKAMAREWSPFPDWFLQLRLRWTVGAIVGLGLAAVLHA